MNIEISTDFIKLDSAMKLAGAVAMGSDAKHVILEGRVTVNGQAELRRGKKLYPGDKFCFENKEYKIVKENHEH